MGRAEELFDRVRDNGATEVRRMIAEPVVEGLYLDNKQKPFQEVTRRASSPGQGGGHDCGWVHRLPVPTSGSSPTYAVHGDCCTTGRGRRGRGSVSAKRSIISAYRVALSRSSRSLTIFPSLR